MSDATMEQKLRLVQQVRSRYQEDQYDLSNRERILYGRTSISPERAVGYGSYYDDYYPEGALPGEGASSFRLRLFLAMFLVMLVIVMDVNGIAVAGITTEKIYEVISADYEEVLETWVEAISSNVRK